MTFIWLALAAFSLGLYGTLTRRDIIGVLASVEVMLGSATLLLVGLASTSMVTGHTAPQGVTGAVGLTILVLAAAEASVGLALMLTVAKRVKTTRLDELMEVKD